MNYVNAKNAAEIKLDGISVAFDKVDRGLQAVYLRDASGNRLRIAINSSSLQVQVPAPPEMEKRYVLRGEVPALGKVEKVFVEKHEAEGARDELTSAMRGDKEFTITCEEVEVAPNGVAANATDDAIPF